MPTTRTDEQEALYNQMNEPALLAAREVERKGYEEAIAICGDTAELYGEGLESLDNLKQEEAKVTLAFDIIVGMHGHIEGRRFEGVTAEHQTAFLNNLRIMKRIHRTKVGEEKKRRGMLEAVRQEGSEARSPEENSG